MEFKSKFKKTVRRTLRTNYHSFIAHDFYIQLKGPLLSKWCVNYCKLLSVFVRRSNGHPGSWATRQGSPFSARFIWSWASFCLHAHISKLPLPKPGQMHKSHTKVCALQSESYCESAILFCTKVSLMSNHSVYTLWNCTQVRSGIDF